MFLCKSSSQRACPRGKSQSMPTQDNTTQQTPTPKQALVPKPEVPKPEGKEQILAAIREQLKDSRFCNVCAEAVRDAHRLLADVTYDQLARFARCLAADLGRIDKAQAKGLKLGDKLDKDGYLTLRILNDKIKTKLSPSFQMVKIIVACDTARYWGLDVEQCTLVLAPELVRWLNNEPEPEGN